MTIQAEVVHYRRNVRAIRISGTRVIYSGLYEANDGHAEYLAQGQTFPFSSRGMPLTWCRDMASPGGR